MYRFRKAFHLLDGFRELENQEIYFASPEELNDPMEGFRDLYWKGDGIVWENFLKTYVKSVEHAVSLLLILGDRKRIDESDILVSPHQRPNQNIQYQKIIDLVVERFLQNSLIRKFHKKLASRSLVIRRDELLSYLRVIHIYALQSVSEILVKNGMVSKPIFSIPNSMNKVLNGINFLVSFLTFARIDIEKRERTIENIFSIANRMIESLYFEQKYSADIPPNVFFVLAEFPQNFLSQLETLLYPDWYSASFLRNCNNPAVWGHYGDSHKGVCMKFKVHKEEGKNYLKFYRENGFNGSGITFDWMKHEFHSVIYSDKPQEIDFFRSIGRMSRILLEHEWYSDKKGNKSSYGDHLENEEEWQETYWSNFIRCNTSKLKAWEYEQEERLILAGYLHDYTKPETRKLKYSFDSLEGIIFGIKTASSDKYKIMKIIETKCKEHGRTDFKFFQAYYSKQTGEIRTHKL